MYPFDYLYWVSIELRVSLDYNIVLLWPAKCHLIVAFTFTSDEDEPPRLDKALQTRLLPFTYHHRALDQLTSLLQTLSESTRREFHHYHTHGAKYAEDRCTQAAGREARAAS